MDWRARVYCGSLTTSDQGRDVLLMGWVDAIRDHGNLLFIHLRDIRGIVQIVFNPDIHLESYEKAAALREESVVEVRGKVELRRKGTENPNLETGEVEVFSTALEILSEAKPLPFQISEKAMIFEEFLSLFYMYLELKS